MTENLQRIANENISLQTQLLDLSRRIDHETLLKNERELQALNNSSQVFNWYNSFSFKIVKFCLIKNMKIL